MSKFICMIDGELPVSEPESVSEPSTILEPSVLSGPVPMGRDYASYQAAPIAEGSPLNILSSVERVDASMTVNFENGVQSPFLIVSRDREMRLPLRTAFNDSARFDRDVVFNGDETVFNGQVNFLSNVAFNGVVFINGREITSQMIDRLADLAR